MHRIALVIALPVMTVATSASTAPTVIAPITTAYQVGGEHICIPDTWTEGATAFAGPPRCGGTPGRHIWDSDVSRPCGPCAFEFKSDVTTRERLKHGNACCFRGSSPHGP
jgi:hypothetical protein